MFFETESNRAASPVVGGNATTPISGFWFFRPTGRLKLIREGQAASATSTDARARARVATHQARRSATARRTARSPGAAGDSAIKPTTTDSIHAHAAESTGALAVW